MSEQGPLLYVLLIVLLFSSMFVYFLSTHSLNGRPPGHRFWESTVRSLCRPAGRTAADAESHFQVHP